MAVFLSVLTAALFGAGDFLGGLAGRRIRVIQVLAASHLVGLVGITFAALVLADDFIAVDLVWGAAAGVAGFVGLGLLYRGLARGPMGVVAPLTAITSAAVPAAWGVVIGGDVLSGGGWAGVAIALASIVLVSGEPAGARGVPALTVIEGLLAGTGFGFMFIILEQTDAASAPWPIVGARLLTGGGLLLVFAVRRERIVPTDPITCRLVLGLGVLDTEGDVQGRFVVQDQRPRRVVGGLPAVGLVLDEVRGNGGRRPDRVVDRAVDHGRGGRAYGLEHEE